MSMIFMSFESQLRFSINSNFALFCTV